MGLLVDGKWQDRWYDTSESGGRFKRKPSAFRHQMTPSEGDGPFPAAPGRYHLYVSYACPWAHRTLIVRQLKGLTRAVSVSVVDPHMGDEGWEFSSYPGATQDPINSARQLHQVYTAADYGYTGRVTVPVLWDKQQDTIVNNESAEIIRFFNGPMAPFGDPEAPDLYPEHLAREIDGVNGLIYDTVNNGVYRAGFATTQEAYDEAVTSLFETLDQLETRLERQRFLVGSRLTEADIRLFTTLVRFDAVYHGHFKCNIRRLVDYPNLWAYTRELYQLPGVASTTRMDHIRTHYYWSHTSINPSRVVPAGPALDLEQPHGRERLPMIAA